MEVRQYFKKHWHKETRTSGRKLRKFHRRPRYVVKLPSFNSRQKDLVGGQSMSLKCLLNRNVAYWLPCRSYQCFFFPIRLPSWPHQRMPAGKEHYVRKLENVRMGQLHCLYSEDTTTEKLIRLRFCIFFPIMGNTPEVYSKNAAQNGKTWSFHARSRTVMVNYFRE